MKETGWMIEHRKNTYWLWNGKPKRDGSNAWTTNSLEGIRFSRKIDADICAISQGFRLSNVMATEHIWGD